MDRSESNTLPFVERPISIQLYDAVAATKLVSDERLSLDKTIEDYLPELVGRIENAEEITLRLLIQHRSGIPNSKLFGCSGFLGSTNREP